MSLSLSGVVLGLRSKPYDFTDDDGKRNAGTSHRLVMFDPEAVEPVELNVPQDHLGLVAGLAEGELVEVNVRAFAKNNKITFSVAGIKGRAEKPARANS